MILIADSGSSTTDWYVIRKDQPGIRVQTEGLNPNFTSPDRIDTVLYKDLIPLIFPEKTDQVIFYGAGCGRASKRDLISDLLKEHFQRADIEVNTDLLGAARALFGNERGIAGILGTGSNLCVYSGRDIEKVLPSLGFILGDEGSGASLGITLLRSYIREELPPELVSAFEGKYRLDYERIMDSVYLQPYPNRWAASLCPFLHEHLDHPFISELVLNNFRYFLYKNLQKLPDWQSLPVRFSGSVAHHFQDTLKNAASEMGIQVDRILASPLEGLIQFHKPAGW